MRNKHIQQQEEAQAIKLFDEDDFECAAHPKAPSALSVRAGIKTVDHQNSDIMKLLSAEAGHDTSPSRRGSSKFRQAIGGNDDVCVLRKFAKMQSMFYEKVLTY